MRTRRLLLCLALLALATVPKLSATTNGFIVPLFRGSPNSEAGYWESFTVPVGAPGNLADRPGATSGALLTQSDPLAFITGSGNLYNLDGISSFSLTDSTTFTLGTVVLQARTLGSELDYNSVLLTYIDGTGTQSLAPLFHTEVDRGTILGASVSSLWQWDLSGRNVDSYSITFSAAAPSLSFDSMTLDTYNQFAQVPEPSTYAIAGLGFALLLLRRVRRR